MDGNGMIFRCPECQYTACLFDFDVLGVQDGELACPECYHVGPMVECEADEAEEVNYELEK